MALLVEKQCLQAKLRAIEAQIEENDCGKKKLQTLMLMVQELKKLPPYLKGSKPAIDMLKQLHEDVKEEHSQADQFLKRLHNKTSD